MTTSAPAATPPRSKSRKVNAYVKTVLKWRGLARKAAALDEVKLREAALTGGQKAEALRLLREIEG